MVKYYVRKENNRMKPSQEEGNTVMSQFGAAAGSSDGLWFSLTETAEWTEKDRKRERLGEVKCLSV